jgi:glycosyltransferase involved in cell wall biosynthesis
MLTVIEPPSADRMVSIIVSNFNYGRFIKQAISSALQQNYRPTEVIVVDDGSTDNSRQVMEEFGNRILALYKENGGLASAWNAGFRASRGDVVIFLDADDILLPTAAARAVALFDTANVVKVHWPLWYIDSDGQRLPGRCPENRLIEGDLRETVLEYGPQSFQTPPGGGAAWSRSLLDEILPLPEPEFRNGTDAYLLNVAPLFGTMRAVQEPQACYRKHGSSDSSGSMRAYIKKAIRWDEECCKLIEGHARRLGLKVGPHFWRRETSYHRMEWVLSDIDNSIAREETFVIADQGGMQPTDLLSGRRCFPFMEHDGIWWGNPHDDDAAIGELERLRNRGARYFVVAWSSFWYFERYPKFATLLRANFTCILSNDRTVIFDMR